MYYSIHTIGLRKTFRNHIEYNAAVKSLYEKATGRFGMFSNEDEDEYYAGIFQGKGIRVFLKRTKISGYYDFILSLDDLIEGEDRFKLIRPENLQLALDTAEEMLVGEFGEEFSINNLELYRVDHCINLNVGTSECVGEYIYHVFVSAPLCGKLNIIRDNVVGGALCSIAVIPTEKLISLAHGCFNSSNPGLISQSSSGCR